VSQYLANVNTVTNSGQMTTGSVEVNGVVYANSVILDPNPGYPASISYNLGRQWGKLDMTVGLSDDSAEHQSVQFQLVGDGNTIYTHTFVLGQSQNVALNVTGVLRLDITATVLSTSYVGPISAVLGNADLLS
jgi:hypothetical protein